MGKGNYLGEFEQLVLLALATVGEDAPGREVYEEIARTTGRDVAVTAVYVTLNRLLKKGYVSAEIARTSQRIALGGKGFSRLMHISMVSGRGERVIGLVATTRGQMQGAAAC